MKQLPCDTAVVLRPYFGEMTSFLDSRGGMPYVYIIVYIYIYMQPYEHRTGAALSRV